MDRFELGDSRGVLGGLTDLIIGQDGIDGPIVFVVHGWSEWGEQAMSVGGRSGCGL